MADVTRQSAAKMLKVSLRTIDRYIRSGRLSAKTVSGRIVVSEKDLVAMKKIRSVHGVAPRMIPEPVAAGYHDLYDETIRLLEEKEQKLQQANYRIGQLESQMQNPFAIKSITSVSDMTSREQEFSKREQEFMKKLERERLNRRIISVILYIVLILQPILWYLLRPDIFTNGF